MIISNREQRLVVKIEWSVIIIWFKTLLFESFQYIYVLLTLKEQTNFSNKPFDISENWNIEMEKKGL